MPQKGKKRKKSWKERQRERQKKQQRAQETYRLQRERKVERKPSQWPKGKVIFGVCMVAVLFIAYGTWQYYNSQLPPSFGGTTNNPPPIGSAPNFSIKDINGTQFSLGQFSGKVIIVHFMAVGCHGQIYPIDENQLKQLKSICGSYCGKEPISIITVAVATCPSSNLIQIRSTYDATWVFGNDYEDGKMDIVDAYVPYGIKDGSILVVDKSFDVVEVYTESVSASTLSSMINQLL